MFGLFNILIVLRSLHNSPAFHSHAGDSDSEEEVHTEIVILPGFTRLCCNFRYFNFFARLCCNFGNFTFLVLPR